MKVGVIGLGDMGGEVCARRLAKFPDIEVYGADIPDTRERREELEAKFAGSGINILDDGYAVSGLCAHVFHAEEVKNSIPAAQQYGPSTKPGTVLVGIASVMTPQKVGFRDSTDEGVHLRWLHQLHGPSINPKGQTAVVVDERLPDPGASRDSSSLIERLGYRLDDIQELGSADEHDHITADTQVGVHAQSQSVGTALQTAGLPPWAHPSYTAGVDFLNVLRAYRFYDMKPHIPEALAKYNPHAPVQFRTYANVISDLVGMMERGEEDKFRKTVMEAGDFVFNNGGSRIGLDEKIMKDHKLSGQPPRGVEIMPNSRVSYLGKVVTWFRLKIHPYAHRICETPPAMLALGGAEHIFMTQSLLEECLSAPFTSDREIRDEILRQDAHFMRAAWGWDSAASINGGFFDPDGDHSVEDFQRIRENDSQDYALKFGDTAEFLADKQAEAKRKFVALTEHLAKREEAT